MTANRKIGNDASIDTRLVHAGEPSPRIEGAVAMPIVQSATFLLTEGADYHDIEYIRLNNTPNHQALHAKLAAIEGGETALVTASGMAAITTALLTLLRKGDHVLAQNCLYGGTYSFVGHDLPEFGISHDFVDLRDPGSWEAKLRPETKIFYVETITNPLMEVGDLLSVVEFAKAHDLLTLIDNTFATPVNFRPLDHGFDLVLHSATKYLNGHADIVAGAAVGRAGLVGRIKRKLDHLGGSLDPHAAVLLHRGLKTLALRMERHGENALGLARFLDAHPAVERVHYPGLEGHPDHARASHILSDYGGMLSFEMKSAEAARKVVNALELPVRAPSLGTVESLVSMPAFVSHAGLTPEERKAAGIADGLIRVSVGIEGLDDLRNDFERALGR